MYGWLFDQVIRDDFGCETKQIHRLDTELIHNIAINMPRVLSRWLMRLDADPVFIWRQASDVSKRAKQQKGLGSLREYASSNRAKMYSNSTYESGKLEVGLCLEVGDRHARVLVDFDNQSVSH